MPGIIIGGFYPVASKPPAPKVTPPLVLDPLGDLAKLIGTVQTEQRVPADAFAAWSAFRSVLGVGVPQSVNRARAAARAMSAAVKLN